MIISKPCAGEKDATGLGEPPPGAPVHLRAQRWRLGRARARPLPPPAGRQEKRPP